MWPWLLLTALVSRPTTMPKSYTWDEFREVMARMCKARSDEWKELLKIHAELDRIAVGIATRPMNLREGVVAYVLALLSIHYRTLF